MGVVEARQMFVRPINDRAFKVQDGLDTWMVLVLEGRVHCNCGASPCDHRLAVKLHKPSGETGGPTETKVDIRLSTEDPRWYRNDNRGLPHWLTGLRDHQIEAIEQIRDAFDNGADVVFVEAPTGCLGGETELVLNRAGKGFRMTIAELYEKFHGRLDNNKGWDLRIPTCVAQGDMDTMTVRSNRIANVLYSGLKDTIILRTWDEKAIRLTRDHRVMTKQGWREAGLLEPGDHVLVNGGRDGRKKPPPKPYYPQVMGLKGHPRAGLRREHPKGGWRVPRHILVVEADMNGLTYEEYVERLRTGESDFEFINGETHHVHHRDNDSKNYALDNLVLLTKAEHQRHHGNHAHVAEQLRYRAVERITPGGMAMTFDIEMAGGGPHFMAEGIYVHNSGKTVIGELARRDNGVTGIYVCSGLDLQRQFAKDFQYAATVKGRSNYPTLTPGSWPEITAADCDKEQIGDEMKCTWCGRETFNCPYEMAKKNAVASKLANVNTTYSLTEWNYVGGLSGRDVVIVDEADLLEGEVMGFVEFTIGPKVVRELNLTVPKKGVHAATIESWLRDDVLPVAKAKLASIGKQGGASVQTVRAKKMYAGLVQDVNRVLAAGLNFGETEGGDGGWVRVYESRGGRGASELDRFTLKPIKVGEVARKVLWPHASRWVLMSATLVSVDEMVDSLGLREMELPEVDEATGEIVGRRGARWEEVHVPAVFPVENRQIVASGVADMTRKGQEKGGLQDLLWGIGVVLDKHETENVLIHTHTYALAKEVVREYSRHPALHGRRVWTYQDSRDREEALEGYKRDGGVLIAPSMDRGIDLPGDQCRVQVICKLPMPYLGDAQISARLKTRGGDLWYAAQTARGLIQMTGRAVRGVEDWATTYVLDSTFGNWKKRNKSLLPGWWQDAVTYVPKKLFEGEVDKRAAGHRERMGG